MSLEMPSPHKGRGLQPKVMTASANRNKMPSKHLELMAGKLTPKKQATNEKSLPRFMSPTAASTAAKSSAGISTKLSELSPNKMNSLPEGSTWMSRFGLNKIVSKRSQPKSYINAPQTISSVKNVSSNIEDGKENIISKSLSNLNKNLPTLPPMVLPQESSRTLIDASEKFLGRSNTINRNWPALSPLKARSNVQKGTNKHPGGSSTHNIKRPVSSYDENDMSPAAAALEKFQRNSMSQKSTSAPSLPMVIPEKENIRKLPISLSPVQEFTPEIQSGGAPVKPNVDEVVFPKIQSPPAPRTGNRVSRNGRRGRFPVVVSPPSKKEVLQTKEQVTPPAQKPSTANFVVFEDHPADDPKSDNTPDPPSPDNDDPSGYKALYHEMLQVAKDAEERVFGVRTQARGFAPAISFETPKSDNLRRVAIQNQRVKTLKEVRHRGAALDFYNSQLTWREHGNPNSSQGFREAGRNDQAGKSNVQEQIGLWHGAGSSQMKTGPAVGDGPPDPEDNKIGKLDPSHYLEAAASSSKKGDEKPEAQYSKGDGGVGSSKVSRLPQRSARRVSKPTTNASPFNLHPASVPRPSPSTSGLNPSTPATQLTPTIELQAPRHSRDITSKAKPLQKTTLSASQILKSRIKREASLPFASTSAAASSSSSATPSFLRGTVTSQARVQSSTPSFPEGSLYRVRIRPSPSPPVQNTSQQPLKGDSVSQNLPQQTPEQPPQQSLKGKEKAVEPFFTPSPNSSKQARHSSSSEYSKPSPKPQAVRRPAQKTTHPIDTSSSEYSQPSPKLQGSRFRKASSSQYIENYSTADHKKPEDSLVHKTGTSKSFEYHSTASQKQSRDLLTHKTEPSKPISSSPVARQNQTQQRSIPRTRFFKPNQNHSTAVQKHFENLSSEKTGSSQFIASSSSADQKQYRDHSIHKTEPAKPSQNYSTADRNQSQDLSIDETRLSKYIAKSSAADQKRQSLDLRIHKTSSFQTTDDSSTTDHERDSRDLRIPKTRLSRAIEALSAEDQKQEAYTHPRTRALREDYDFQGVQSTRSPHTTKLPTLEGPPDSSSHASPSNRISFAGPSDQPSIRQYRSSVPKRLLSGNSIPYVAPLRISPKSPRSPANTQSKAKMSSHSGTPAPSPSSPLRESAVQPRTRQGMARARFLASDFEAETAYPSGIPCPARCSIAPQYDDQRATMRPVRRSVERPLSPLPSERPPPSSALARRTSSRLQRLSMRNLRSRFHWGASNPVVETAGPSTRPDRSSNSGLSIVPPRSASARLLPPSPQPAAASAAFQFPSGLTEEEMRVRMAALSHSQPTETQPLLMPGDGVVMTERLAERALEAGPGILANRLIRAANRIRQFTVGAYEAGFTAVATDDARTRDVAAFARARRALTEVASVVVGTMQMVSQGEMEEEEEEELLLSGPWFRGERVEEEGEGEG
ncbi:MAG: hypothetical protein M1814_001833 [Vezdaea aestivalis]|nr:MAG: hypothetical protein M1814_001833 [Vezdaea aestivalis]